MVAVRDRLGAFGDTEPVVVTFADDPARLAAYRTHLDVPFTLVADVDRSLYRALGFGRGSLRQVWSLGTLAMYRRLLVAGRRVQQPLGALRDDTRQLGGDALVDREGRLHRHWSPATPDARPSVDELLEAVTALDGRSA